MIAGQRTRLLRTQPNDIAVHVAAVETSLSLIIETLDGTSIGRLDIEAIDLRHRSAHVMLSVGEPDAAGQDLCRDALTAVCRHLFEQRGLHRVDVTVTTDDDRAVHVYEQLGFRREGVLRDHIRVDGALRDEIVMSLLSGELRD